MHLHVVSLPHTQVTAAFSACAFTEKVRKFCIMMRSRGHNVTLYAGEESEVAGAELVTCISETERTAALAGLAHYTQASFDPRLPHWAAFNARAAAEIKRRAAPHDIVCVIGGSAHKPVADALPGMMVVEFGIGYAGTFAPYRVFESYAWMHVVYGAAGGYDPGAARGDHWYDAVIPGFIEGDAFPFVDHEAEALLLPDEVSLPDDYCLFVGRIDAHKGLRVAVDACREAGVRLVVAGPGTPPPDVEHVGVVGPEERGQLMARAKALLAPTEYIEPFGMVVVEAQACGTPTITTDWGAFTETNIHGVTGYRCRTLAEFVNAISDVERLDRAAIRDHAQGLYTLGPIGARYDAYFERLQTLWGNGWYARAVA